jgi:hypothetical protein
MAAFKVVWAIDIDADDARMAAVQAQTMLRDDTEIDWVYQVTDYKTGITEEVDLDVGIMDDYDIEPNTGVKL